MTHSSERGGGKHIAKGLEIKTLRNSDREINREAPEVLTPQAHVNSGKIHGKICLPSSYSPGCYEGHEDWMAGESQGPLSKIVPQLETSILNLSLPYSPLFHHLVPWSCSLFPLGMSVVSQEAPSIFPFWEMEIASLLKQWFPRGQVEESPSKVKEARCSEWGTILSWLRLLTHLAHRSHGVLVVLRLAGLSRSELALLHSCSSPQSNQQNRCLLFVWFSAQRHGLDKLYAESWPRWLGGEMRKRDLGWHPKLRQLFSFSGPLAQQNRGQQWEGGGLRNSQLWGRHPFAWPIFI